jgi:hypothetical protein
VFSVLKKKGYQLRISDENGDLLPQYFEEYIILEWIVGWEGVDWMDLAQYWYQWRALVNMVMNLRLP